MFLHRRRRIAEIFDSRDNSDSLGRIVNILLIVLISLNVLAIVLESEAGFFKRYELPLLWFEIFSIMVFTIEYVLRVWSCVDTPTPDSNRSGTADSLFRQRLRYMMTPMALIDLISIAPSYIAFFVGIDLRFLRVVRLLRVFKLTRYSGAMYVLLSVLREEASSLMAAFFILFVLLIVASSGIYLIEHDVQPDTFGSIPSSMWWAMATLTTVGYGDVVPITNGGKFFGGCITLVGMGMVALPAGILASAFSDQLHRRREQYSEQLDVALKDGVISEEEQIELSRLQDELGLSHVDTFRLKRMMSRTASGQQCPHCGKLLGDRPQ